MNSRYQEWLEHVFGHEIKEPAWHFDLEAPSFDASPTELTALIGQTFLYSGRDLVNYSDAQVDQGLWYMVSASGSDFMFSLKSPGVPIDARLQTVESIYHLYADCFAKRCTETLGHLSEPGSDLNSICYMFWDVCPITYLEDVPERVQMENAIFSVLERTLTIKHRACREAALHGLAEMQLSVPERTQSIIENFLKEAKPDKALAVYAQNAREGNVL